VNAKRIYRLYTADRGAPGSTTVDNTAADPRDKLEHWRQDYNRVRPHSALGDSAPEEFASARQTAAAMTMSSGALREGLSWCYRRFQTAGKTGANRSHQVDYSTASRPSFTGDHSFLVVMMASKNKGGSER
jgi:hypothetical protein